MYLVRRERGDLPALQWHSDQWWSNTLLSLDNYLAYTLWQILWYVVYSFPSITLINKLNISFAKQIVKKRKTNAFWIG